MDCPLCGQNSRNFHLGIPIGVPAANCWRCGKLNFWWVLREIGVSYKLAKQLDLRGGGTLVAPEHTGHYKRLDMVKPMATAHIDYLVGRGLDPATAVTEWEAEGTGIHPTHPWRIFIPIRFRGRLISWTTRSIGKKDKKKYLTAPAIHESLPHKQSLYGIDKCQHVIIVVEGPLDVWNIGPGAAGTYGLGHTPAQVALIARFPVRVVCFDNSNDAQARADKLCNDLAIWPGVTHKAELDAEDPGSACREEVSALRKFAGL